MPTPFSNGFLYFATIWLALLFSTFGSGEGYRTFAYLNAVLVLAYSVNYLQSKQEIPWRLILLSLLFPASFLLLNSVAGFHAEDWKLVTRFSLLVFMYFGILLLEFDFPKLNFEIVNKSLILLISLFAIGQFLVFTLHLNPEGSWHYGTMNNPHHLALYIAVSLPFLAYNLMHSSTKAAIWIIFILSIEAYLLLQTSSRPAWLALLAGGMAVVPFWPSRVRLRFVALLAGIPLLLYLIDPLKVHERVNDLVYNIRTEERVSIWTDTWRMLQHNSWPEWIYGHGLGAFFNTFKAYSSFHGTMDFNFPHNFVLELIFKSGIVGLLLAISIYISLCNGLIKLAKNHNDPTNHQLAIVLLATTAIHFFDTFLVLPFFSHYNLYVLTLLFAARHYLLRKNEPA